MATDILIGSETPAETTVIGVAKRTLNDAEIKAMPTAPYPEIIPAPGAGKMISILKVIARLVTAATYTNGANTATMMLLVGDTQTTFATLPSFFDGVVDYTTDMPPYFDTPGTSAIYDLTAAFENQPVSAFISNGGSGNFTGGNAANTLEITVYYVLVDLP